MEGDYNVSGECFRMVQSLRFDRLLDPNEESFRSAEGPHAAKRSVLEKTAKQNGSDSKVYPSDRSRSSEA